MYGTKLNALTGFEEPDQTADGAGWAYAAPTGGINNSAVSVPIRTAANVAKGFGTTAALRNFITGLQISTDTLSANTEMIVLNGATPIWRSLLRAGAGANVPYAISFPNGALFSSPGAVLSVQLLTAVTGAVYLSAQGYAGL